MGVPLCAHIRRRPETYLEAAAESINASADHDLLVSFKLKPQYHSRMEAMNAMRRNGLGMLMKYNMARQHTMRRDATDAAPRGTTRQHGPRKTT